MTKRLKLLLKTGRSSADQDKKSPFSFSFKKKHCNLLLIGLIVVSSIFYLLQMNHMGVKGYRIKDLENRVEQLQEDNEELQLKNNEMRSLGYIKKELANSFLVEGGRVEYVSAAASSLAAK